MVIPKFSYLTGLAIQLFAIIFIVTKHNVVGGILLFFTGDFQMLLAIRFSRLKKNKFFTIFDIGISSFYFIIYILIYYTIIYDLAITFVPKEVDVMILIIHAYACFRLLFPLMNLGKGKIVTIFCNLLFVSWLIPLVIFTEKSYFAILSKAFFIQVLYLLGGTLIFCFISGIKILKSTDLFQGCGCLLLLIIAFGAYQIFFIGAVFVFLFVAQAAILYFYALILIWFLVFNYITFQYEDIKNSEDQLAGLMFVVLFYFILLILIASIFPLLNLLGVIS